MRLIRTNKQLLHTNFLFQVIHVLPTESYYFKVTCIVFGIILNIETEKDIELSDPDMLLMQNLREKS